MAGGPKRKGRPPGVKDKVKRKGQKKSHPAPPSVATYYSKSTNTDSDDASSSESENDSQQSCNLSNNSNEGEWNPAYEGVMADEDSQNGEQEAAAEAERIRLE